MALDYSARRQVSRNRPKRRPIGRYLLLAFAGVSVVYGLGLGTGWFLFGRDGKEAPRAATPPPPDPGAKQAAGQAPPGAAVPAAGPGAAAEGTDLTFFKTLPKGEQSIMGSGLNPQHESRSAQATTPPVPTAHKTEKPDAGPATPDKPKAKPATETKPAPGPDKSLDEKQAEKGKDVYAVQVASYTDKKEAEQMKATLEQKGFSVRISESTVQGKGVRYRVRVGKGLRRDGASQLASKLGGSAMVVTE